MDGTNRVVLHRTNLFNPHSLTLDIPTQTLFWIDRGSGIVESSVNGRNIRSITQAGSFTPIDITVKDGLVYIINGDSIRKVPVTGGNTVVVQRFPSCLSLYEINVVDRLKQPIGKQLLAAPSRNSAVVVLSRGLVKA